MYLDVKPKRKDNMDARRQAQQLAGMGRYGDTMLMHVNPKEVEGIASLIPITTNPQTGQPEMFIGALLGSLLGSTFLPGLAGGSMLGAAGAGAIGSALGTWAETGDLEKGIMSGIMGYGLGSVFGEVGSGSEALGEIASEESLKAAALQTPVPTQWVAERAAQTAGEEVSKEAMSDWIAQSGTERLGDIGRNLFSKNTLSSLSENYLPIALGGGSLGAQEAQEQFERDMAEWRAGKGKRREELLAKYPEQISPRSPYYQPPLYGAQGGQIPHYEEGGQLSSAPGGTQIITDTSLYPWMNDDTGDDTGDDTSDTSNIWGNPPAYTPPEPSIFADAPTGSVLERYNQANAAGLPLHTTLKSPFAKSGLAPWQMQPVAQTDEAGEIVYDDDGNIVYTESPYLYGPEGQLIPPKTYMPGIDPEFNYFPGRVRSAGSITGGGSGTDGGGSDTDYETETGGTGDSSLQEYINNLLATGGYSEQDWLDYISGLGPDITGFMSEQDFQDWYAGQDFSQYATNQDFQDWLSNQDWSQYQNQDFQNWYDQFDWGQFATNQDFQDWLSNQDWSQYQNQDFQNWYDQFDWGQFATDQDFQDWLNNQDWSQYGNEDFQDWYSQFDWDQFATNQDFQDWISGQDFSQFATKQDFQDWMNNIDWSQYATNQDFQDWTNSIDWDQFATDQEFQDWSSGQDFSKFDPTSYDWKDIFDQYAGGQGFDPYSFLYDPKRDFSGSTDDPQGGGNDEQMAMQGGGQIEMQAGTEIPVDAEPLGEYAEDLPLTNYIFSLSKPEQSFLLDKLIGLTGFTVGSFESIPFFVKRLITTGSLNKPEVQAVIKESMRDTAMQQPVEQIPPQQELQEQVIAAVLGQHPDPDSVIQAFIEKYGIDAFLQLRDSVLQQQVPNAQTEGIISGQGGGMDDMVNGMIGNQQGIAVSPGEYIVPADVVSMLGDGSSDSGADKLDGMLEKIRVNKTGTTVQAEEIDEQEVLPT